ncbi:zinc finger protein basonuclin-2-like isoform X1 [Bolinopsis microptera]|uniref:zinc finger protein basonuclin-2-like isoform X1 n=1 Tax=Bolinopsis microptera TaxID=2820187 RepID=UPI00307AFF01
MAIAHDPYEVAPPVEHGWATTALHSMLSKEASSEELKSVWTTAALVLKGYDAVPVELKILLDRLFATYHDSIRLERRHRLAYLGWSEEEYERGYKIVDNTGRELSRWSRWRDPTETIRTFVKYPCTQEIALNMLDELERRDEEESLIDYGSNRKRARKKQSRTVPCPEVGCTRMCRSQAELAIHRNSHTKERPFKCPWNSCISAFGDKSTMKSHYSAIHLKDLKFKCKVPGCNKAFGTARSRNRHSENIKLHQQLFAQSYPTSQIPLHFNSPPPPPFSCYESSFLPNYGGFGPYSSGLPSTMGPVDCKPTAGIPPHSAALLYSDCKPPGPYSPVHPGVPPHCV